MQLKKFNWWKLKLIPFLFLHLQQYRQYRQEQKMTTTRIEAMMGIAEELDFPSEEIMIGQIHWI